MIYGDVYKLMANTRKPGLFSFQIEDDSDAFDESTGRFRGDNMKGKEINIMYGGGMVAHPEKIRLKVGPSSDFTKDGSEVIVNYDDKEWEYKGKRDMSPAERSFAVGFMSRYDDLLYGIAAGKYDLTASTKVIDNDMKANFLHGKKRYDDPTGKVVVSGQGKDISLSPASKDEEIPYTYNQVANR